MSDDERIQGQLFLRRGGSFGFRRTGGDGLLPLRVRCRHWSAGPINAFTLWKPEAVKITKGAGNVGSFAKTPKSIRKWCKTCGGHLLTEHPAMGLTDVYAAILPKLAFKPGLHVHYQETVLHIKDGLPKQKDAPAELGVVGVTLAE